MAKADDIVWGDGDPSYAIEPSAGKKALGWTAGEKPPFQYMNWIHLTTALWVEYLVNKVEANVPTMLYSAGSATWNGSTLTLSQPLSVSFRVTTGNQVNNIPAAGYALADGEVLVLKKNKTGASPVTTAQDAYGSLDIGEFAIVAQSAMTAVDEENETIIFRRRGTNLDIIPTGSTYASGSTIFFGDVDVVEVPIGSIIPFYDFNGALTFDTNKWVYCDGSTATVGGVSRTLPDLSNRYLVGFGTEGGGDNDTAAWATTAVGNASHQINIQHDHTGPSHTHSIGSHTHGPGTLSFQIGSSTWTTGSNTMTTSLYPLPSIHGGSNSPIEIFGHNNWDATYAATPGRGVGWWEHLPDSGGGTSDQDWWTRQTNSLGVTDSSSGTSGSGGTGNTSSSLSTTQSIQPRSIRVRYLMRAA